jgi:hypothetical protein
MPWKLIDKEGNELPLPVRCGRWGKQVRIEFDSATVAMKAFHSLCADMGYPDPSKKLPPLTRQPVSKAK